MPANLAGKAESMEQSQEYSSHIFINFAVNVISRPRSQSPCTKSLEEADLGTLEWGAHEADGSMLCLPSSRQTSKMLRYEH